MGLYYQNDEFQLSDNKQNIIIYRHIKLWIFLYLDPLPNLRKPLVTLFWVATSGLGTTGLETLV